VMHQLADKHGHGHGSAESHAAGHGPAAHPAADPGAGGGHADASSPMRFSRTSPWRPIWPTPPPPSRTFPRNR
jgi:hypothetical protein